jgi:hypothetical protein
MLLEEFFKHNPEDDQSVVQYFYIATLQAWLLNNEFEIFDNILKFFEQREEYLMCEGIHQAIDKIDEIYNDRFSEATAIHEDEDKIEYTYEEHRKVSRLIFEDIIKEIYEKQIDRHKKNS